MNGINSNHQQINQLQSQPGNLIKTSSASSEGQRVPQQSIVQAWYTSDGRIESGNTTSSRSIVQGQPNNMNQHQQNGK